MSAADDESGPIRLVDDTEASVAVQRIFAGATELLAFVSNFARTAANAPSVARWVIPMIAAIQRGGPDCTLSLQIKELAILRTSTRNECHFCTQHNIRLGRLVDLSDEQIVAVSGDDPEESGLFEERELAAIAWADRVTRNEAHADPAAYERLRAVFSDEEIHELTLAACLFNFLNRFNDSLWIDLDEGAQPGAQLFVEPPAFRRYAETMFSDDVPS